MAIVQIQLREDTTIGWDNSNPILKVAEPGWDTDLKQLKMGDGVTLYNDLPIFSAGGGGVGKVDFDFPTPTQVWVLNHSLQTLTPGIGLYNSTGDKIEGALVNVVSNSQVVVTLGSAIIGKATLIGGAITKTASDTSVDASGFDGNLAPTDTDLQKVAQKVDDLVLGGGGSIYRLFRSAIQINSGLTAYWYCHYGSQNYNNINVSRYLHSGALGSGSFTALLSDSNSTYQILSNVDEQIEKVTISGYRTDILTDFGIVACHTTDGVNFDSFRILLEKNIPIPLPISASIDIPLNEFNYLDIYKGEKVFLVFRISAAIIEQIHTNIKTKVI